MFTGIVEELGTVVELQELSTDLGEAVRLVVAASTVLDDVRTGDSIAVDGCCLTVTEHGEGRWSADVMQQTLRATALRDLGPGTRVNLERAAAVGGRLGGHVVQGHVDGVGQILERTPGERWEVVRIALPAHLARYLVDQGSVTVDGVSLTVVRAGEDDFTVSLIPETLARTTLGRKQVGDRVNLEVDVLAKYVERLIAHRLDPRGEPSPDDPATPGSTSHTTSKQESA